MPKRLSQRVQRQRKNYSTGLPSSISSKIYKTGQTRGSEKDEIYQNRVNRNNTVLVPVSAWETSIRLGDIQFENGYIVIARPDEYFSETPPLPKPTISTDLVLGENLLIFYRTRGEWDKYNPEQFGWKPASSRQSPLQGQYISRVPDTTSSNHSAIFRGFTERSGGQGAGIRVYEYASSETIKRTQYQLAYLAWRTVGMLDLAAQSGTEDPLAYKQHVDDYCEQHGLADKEQLFNVRLMRGDVTVCPLCLQQIRAIDLASRVEQAEGRDIPDLTVTNANLFHVNELRVGVFNHRPYNLGWGHYHCNTVARDIGIESTLTWMVSVLENNGYSVTLQTL